MAEIPILKLDDRWFEIIATSPTAVLSKHRINGNYTIWALEWQCAGTGNDYPRGFEAKAWADYIERQTQ